jgi:ribonuclease P protein component
LNKRVHDEGQAHVPAKYTAPQENARLPGADEHEERTPGSQAAAGQGPQAIDRQQRIGASRLQRFRPNERIRRRVEFQQVYERGTRVQGRFTTLFILATTLTVGRLGIAASKKFGGAVQRNRAKRLVRELFRRHKVAPGFDVVIIPRRELLDASLDALEREYRNNLERSLRYARGKSG